MPYSLLDHQVITARYFFPRKMMTPNPCVVDAGSVQLRCWYRPGKAGQKTLVHFHGNGEVVADYLPEYADAMKQLGVGLFLAEYRGYGGSTGKPQLGRMLDDVKHIVSALVCPTSEMVVYGRSVGSIFAIELAHQHPDIAGLIIESGISDVLQRLLLRMRPEELNTDMASLTAAVQRRMNHREKLAGYTGPLMVMHARDDDLVTPDHAEQNYGWASSENKQLVWFDRGGHNGLLAHNFPAYLTHLNSFLSAL